MQHPSKNASGALGWFASLFIACSLVIVSARALADAPVRKQVRAAEEESVRKTVIDFAVDWNRHDMVAFGKLFAPDADFVNVRGTWMKGRHDIELRHSYSHGTVPADTFPGRERYYGIFKNSKMTFVQTHVRFLRDDVALAHVDWQLTGDRRIASRKGLLTFVLVKENDQWLIASGQNTEIGRKVQ